MAHDFSPVARFVDRLVETKRVDGAGIAVAVDGQPAFEHLAGEALPGRPATADTVWPISSLTKLYTASAIMSVIEEGKLALKTNAHTILPEFRGGGREEITLRHLMTHTAGLLMEPGNLPELLQAGADLEQLLAHAFTDPLLFPPGTGQSYSDTGFGIAGLMAAQVAGVSYYELVRARVLERAGLSQTFIQLPDGEHPRVARVAAATGEGTEWAIYSSRYGSQIGHPAYGMVATLSDLLRFLLLFDPASGKRINSAAGIRAMTTDQTGVFKRESGAHPISPWGAGFMLQVNDANAGIAAPESYGHLGGTGCCGWVDPVNRVSVAFVSNRHVKGGWEEWRDRLEEAVDVALATATAG